MDMYYESKYDLHKEHMKNERIVLDYEVIEKDYICIAGCSTSFIRMERKKEISLDEMLTLIKEVKAIAKTKHVSIKGINKLKKEVEEIYFDYQKEMNKYNEKFDLLVLLWEQNIEDLRTGYRDNLIHHQVLQPLQFEIEKYGYSTNIIRKMSDRYREINRCKSLLMSDKNLVSLQV